MLSVKSLSSSCPWVAMLLSKSAIFFCRDSYTVLNSASPSVFGRGDSGPGDDDLDRGDPDTGDEALGRADSSPGDEALLTGAAVTSSCCWFCLACDG